MSQDCGELLGYQTPDFEMDLYRNRQADPDIRGMCLATGDTEEVKDGGVG